MKLIYLLTLALLYSTSSQADEMPTVVCNLTSVTYDLAAASIIDQVNKLEDEHETKFFLSTPDFYIGTMCVSLIANEKLPMSGQIFCALSPFPNFVKEINRKTREAILLAQEKGIELIPTSPELGSSAGCISLNAKESTLH